MMAGRVFAVVGPSGAGKDSLMAAVLAAQPELHLVRRVITRRADAGGEDFEPATAKEFDRRQAQGEFVLHWQSNSTLHQVLRFLPIVIPRINIRSEFNETKNNVIMTA